MKKDIHKYVVIDTGNVKVSLPLFSLLSFTILHLVTCLWGDRCITERDMKV